MKVLKMIFPLVVLLSFITSCSEKPTSPQIEGNWNLKTIECLCPAIEPFDAGDIVWDFQNDGTIAITINTTLDDDSNVPFQNTSSVNYTLNNDQIEIDSNSYSVTYNENEMSIIASILTEQTTYHFER